jgi:hypothetical protein
MRITRGHTIAYILGILTTVLLAWLFRYRIVAILIYLILKG